MVLRSTLRVRAFALVCVFVCALGEAKLEATQFINIKPSGQLTHEKVKLVRLWSALHIHLLPIYEATYILTILGEQRHLHIYLFSSWRNERGSIIMHYR